MDRDEEELVAEEVLATARSTAEDVILAAARSTDFQESLKYVSDVAYNFSTSTDWLNKLNEQILKLMRGRDASRRNCFLRLIAQADAQSSSTLADMVLHFASLLRVLHKLSTSTLQWTQSMKRAFVQVQTHITNEQVPAFVALMKLCDRAPGDPAPSVREVRQRLDALLEATRGVIGYAREFENEVLRETDPSSPRIRETSAFFTDAFGSLMTKLVPVMRVYWFLVAYLNPTAINMIIVQAREYGFTQGSAAADMLEIVLRGTQELPEAITRAQDWVLLRQTELTANVTKQLKGVVLAVVITVLVQFVSDGTMRQLTDGTFISTQAGLEEGPVADAVNIIERTTVAPAGRKLLDGIAFFVTWFVVSTLLTLVQQRAVSAVVARAASLVRSPAFASTRARLLRPSGPVEGYECVDDVCVPRYRGDPTVPGAQLFVTREACMERCKVERLPPASRRTPRRVSSLSRTTFSPLPFKGGYKDIHKQ